MGSCAVKQMTILISPRATATLEIGLGSTTRHKAKQLVNEGQAAKATEDTDAYKESAPTDAEIADVRKKQLGLKTDDAVDRFLKVEGVQKQYQAAKSGQGADAAFWKKLGEDNYLDPSNKADFVRLFRLSEREQDKNG